MSTKLSTSSPAIVNTLLAEVLSHYEFSFLERTKYFEVYSLYFENKSNCNGKLYLTTLTDNSLRLSISADDDDYTNSIDLFEFKGFGKIHDFLKLVL